MMKKHMIYLMITCITISSLSVIEGRTIVTNEKNDNACLNDDIVRTKGYATYDMSSYQQACTTIPLNYQPKYNCSFLGGSHNDGDFYKGTKLVLVNDHVIVAGSTNSNNFPTIGNVFDSDINGEEDGFIAIFNTNLTKIISCTFLGGSHNDEIRDITTDNFGNIYVVGSTESPDFPLSSNAYDDEYDGGTEMPYGSGDLFVAKFNSDLSVLVSSTYLGGSGHEYANAIDLDEEGHVYITGSTSSSDFPVTDTVFSKHNKGGTVWGDDIFISRLSNDLSTLVASTFLGGSGDDYSEQITIKPSGNVVIGGWTTSADFPTTDGSYDPTYNDGLFDGIISVLNSDLSMVLHSTYIGGRKGWDFVYGMTVDKKGNIYVTGHTSSSDFPVTPGSYDTEYNGNGGQTNDDNLFISIFTPMLDSILNSTFLGGENGFEIGYDIATTNDGYVLLTGTTKSSDFPTTEDAFDRSYNGGYDEWSGDMFISKFDVSLHTLVTSTFFGGRNSDTGSTIDISKDNNTIYVTGPTQSSSFPVTDTSYDSSFNGVSDVFIFCSKHILSTNNAPEKPKISGPSSGKIHIEQTVYTSCIDPDGDQIYYFFDWGDGIDSGWLGPYESGLEIQSSHIWNKKGKYEIKVKVKDVHGGESERSDPLSITIVRSKMKFLFIFDLFERYNKCFNFIYTFFWVEDI